MRLKPTRAWWQDGGSTRRKGTSAEDDKKTRKNKEGKGWALLIEGTAASKVETETAAGRRGDGGGVR